MVIASNSVGNAEGSFFLNEIQPRLNDDHISFRGQVNFQEKKEPPVGGRANAAIAKTLAGYFGVAPSRVSLVSGRASRQKVFEVSV